MQEHQTRSCIKRGSRVKVAVKVNGKYQEELRDGIVRSILTNSKTHHRGIKVRLEDGTVGRVQIIIENIPGEIRDMVEARIAEEFHNDSPGIDQSISAIEERRKELYREYGYKYKTLYERTCKL